MEVAVDKLKTFPIKTNFICGNFHKCLRKMIEIKRRGKKNSLKLEWIYQLIENLMCFLS